MIYINEDGESTATDTSNEGTKDENNDEKEGDKE